MKINEVEALVGITKKNIRFYEEQGLLSPKRNSENSYREYGEEEVQTLFFVEANVLLGDSNQRFHFVYFHVSHRLS